MLEFGSEIGKFVEYRLKIGLATELHIFDPFLQFYHHFSQIGNLIFCDIHSISEHSKVVKRRELELVDPISDPDNIFLNFDDGMRVAVNLLGNSSQIDHCFLILNIKGKIRKLSLNVFDIASLFIQIFGLLDKFFDFGGNVVCLLDIFVPIVNIGLRDLLPRTFFDWRSFNFYRSLNHGGVSDIHVFDHFDDFIGLLLEFFDFSLASN